MSTLSATEARTKLYRLIDQTALSHESIVKMGKEAMQFSYPKMTGVQGKQIHDIKIKHS